MKIIFAGTPDFARVALARLHEAGHDIALVLTQPDRPAGRGLRLQASPVKQFALQHALPLAQARSLRLDGPYATDAQAARSMVCAADAQACVVAAYGLMLPQWILDTPPLGCFNIHASLLPRWRGAAPIHRAILAGDTKTGVTIMQMDAGLDTGNILSASECPVWGDDTVARLHDRLAGLGADLMVRVLQTAADGRLTPIVQPACGVTYAAKIDKVEAVIDWSQPVDAICRRIRALNPQPGCTAKTGGDVFKLWAAHPLPHAEQPSLPHGQILDITPTGLAVRAGQGVVVVTDLQRAGGKRLSLSDFVRGCRLQIGMVFDGV